MSDDKSVRGSNQCYSSIRVTAKKKSDRHAVMRSMNIESA